MFGKSELSVEKYAMPDTIDGIVELLRHVLEGGSVERIELDISDLVRVYRAVSDDGLEELAVSWDSAVRNVPSMTEYFSPGAEPYQFLVDMMHLVHSEKLQSVCFITGPNESDLLERWLEFEARGMPNRNMTQLLGLPLFRVTTLPEETLLLCGSRSRVADPDEIVFVVKTAIELRRDHDTEKSSTADGGSWDNSEERAAAASQLQIDTRRLRRIPWH